MESPIYPDEILDLNKELDDIITGKIECSDETFRDIVERLGAAREQLDF